MSKYSNEQLHYEIKCLDTGIKFLEKKMNEILENQKQDFTKNYDLVTIIDGLNITIYKQGKDITKNVRRVNVNAGEIPTIEYEETIGVKQREERD